MTDTQPPASDHPLLRLPREDLDLITQMVLHSGSLKALAKTYSVSYPTIRARLDRVIERVQAAINPRPADPLTELIADMVQRGELAGHQARRILAVARTQPKETNP